MKTAQELLKEKLVEIGADGLCYRHHCGCSMDCLMICGDAPYECVSGRNNPKMAKEMGVDFWMEPMED